MPKGKGNGKSGRGRGLGRNLTAIETGAMHQLIAGLNASSVSSVQQMLDQRVSTLSVQADNPPQEQPVTPSPVRKIRVWERPGVCDIEQAKLFGQMTSAQRADNRDLTSLVNSLTGAFARGRIFHAGNENPEILVRNTIRNSIDGKCHSDAATIVKALWPKQGVAPVPPSGGRGPGMVGTLLGICPSGPQLPAGPPPDNVLAAAGDQLRDKSLMPPPGASGLFPSRIRTSSDGTNALTDVSGTLRDDKKRKLVEVETSAVGTTIVVGSEKLLPVGVPPMIEDSNKGVPQVEPDPNEMDISEGNGQASVTPDGDLETL